MKQHHLIEIFSANCPLCNHITEDIQIGKCQGCNQIVYDINNMTEEIKVKMRDYGVKQYLLQLLMAKLKLLVFLIFLGYAEKICIQH
jgi:tRNA U54 and U55 pseudouridine synthase Pus10